MATNMRADDFLRELANSPLKRIQLPEVRRLFLQIYKEYDDHPNMRQPLREVLDSLASDGAVILPKSARLWDKHGSPPLPLWVKKVAHTPEVAPEDSPAWLPEFAPIVGTLTASQKRILARINAYCIANRGKLLPVPYRERSLKIFGDEKFLENKLSKEGLFGGRVPMELFFAFRAFEPMPYERPPSLATGRPVIVVENHHSFASFVQANARQEVFSAVCYGAGNTLDSRERHLDVIAEQLSSRVLLYLGDIDPFGLKIPAKVDKARRRRGAAPLQPASELYQWLLRHGRRAHMKKNVPALSSDSLHWLGLFDGTEKVLRDLFSRQQRIPQESLGLEELEELDLQQMTQGARRA